MMAGVHRVNEIAYHYVNGIIGCHREVMMRRDRHDIIDIMRKYIKRHNGITLIQMMSGSMREGFCMKGSDFDYMTWFSKDYVICDLSQAHLYNIYTNSIILMEDQYTSPGFVLLRVCNNIASNYTNQSLVQFNNHHYISSFMFRQAANSVTPYLITNRAVHGPCISGFLVDDECDFAYCFASKHWPPQAYHWIERCKRQCWPSPSVLRSIIHSGCHFMAIGAKNSPLELTEWRLSFSQAEQKLVYCMNHCQFLVYGFLKLFLKEVLNKGIPEDNKLMCSYFMKTVVFWEIQDNNTSQWNIENFLSCSWKCYKHLMKWVYNEYCPNFFVPENNMFYPKITGTRQQRLFCQMLDLYNEGLQCLLRCSSIHDKLFSALINPQQPITNTPYFSEFQHDLILLHYTQSVHFFINPSRMPQKCVEILTFLLIKLKSNISQIKRVLVYRVIIQLYQQLAFFLQTDHIQKTNTEMYTQRKLGLRLMEMTTKNGWVTDMLYLAMYHYIDGRYRQTLCLLQEAQARLYKPYVMYKGDYEYDYMQAMSGKSMSTKIKQAMACNIGIPVYIKFSELRLELRVLQHSKISFLCTSPIFPLYFLSFLCHYHLRSVHQLQYLHILHELVHWQGSKYPRSVYIDIAWQMLGICHQLSNHLSQALECYWEAHRYSPIHMIQQAAIYRIQAVERQILFLNSSSQH